MIREILLLKSIFLPMFGILVKNIK